MNRKSWVAALLMGTLASGVSGAEPATTGGAPTNTAGKGAPPAGVRIAIDGNSWSVWPGLLLPLAKGAGIQGQMEVSKEGKQRLETGEVDVWTYGTHGKPEDGSILAKTA